MAHPASRTSVGSRLARRDSDELQIPGVSTKVTTAIIVGVVAASIIIAILIGCWRTRQKWKGGSMEMGTAGPPILLGQNVGSDAAARASESETGSMNLKSQTVYRKTSV